MGQQKFTVFLMPLDEGGYQAFFPYYPNCVTDGETVEEALAHAKEAMEGILRAEAESGGDPVPGYVYASQVLVGTLDIEVPLGLLNLEDSAQPRVPST